MTKLARDAGLDVHIDSAGTLGHHAGHPPDPRAVAAAEPRGYRFNNLRSRKVTSQDFHQFDLILAMDEANLRDLKRSCPEDLQHKLSLLLAHANIDEAEVPDPYYGGAKGFEWVLSLIETGCEALVQSLHQQQRQSV